MTPHRKEQTSEITHAEGIEATTTFNSNQQQSTKYKGQNVP
jgi:hypothetical protein